MIKVKINEQIRSCDHCGAKNIKRTFEIIYNDTHLYIGRICAERVTGVSTSGNPFRSAERVERALNIKYKDNIEDLLDEMCPQ